MENILGLIRNVGWWMRVLLRAALARKHPENAHDLYIVRREFREMLRWLWPNGRCPECGVQVKRWWKYQRSCPCLPF